MKIKKSIGITTLLLMLLVVSCKPETQQADAKGEKVKVEVATAVAQEMEQLGTFTATAEAEMINQIAPQNAGRIKNIYAEIGDLVSVGQKLVEMDALNLEQTKLQLENNKLEFERVDELYKVGGISKAVWDTKKLAYDLSQRTYDNLLENTILCSPIDGIVMKRNYDKGDMYVMGLPIYVVEQIRPVKLLVNISESIYPYVEKGMNVKVLFDVYGEKEFDGVIKLVHPSIDPATRTFVVEVQVRNSDHKIRPGMFGRVTFNFGTRRQIMLSDRAVQKQLGSADNYVYVCKDGLVSFRKVEIGRRIDNMYEILDGIEDGEVVVVTGHNKLKDGAEVEVIKK
ncbi:MAG: efflux RND transporter periplasmic adaptor subunit [Tannerella sp.]|jgi:RND family efflux transporter MFP subunit|nr:efflux RND transporter periplasmic adaptor subunit [Tannerella sp.]